MPETPSGQYNRFWSVTVGGQTWQSDPSGDPNQSLRCRFELHRHTTQSPGTGKILITNPLRDHALNCKAENQSVTVDAGYYSGHGVIFQGNSVRAIYGRENPTDTLLQVLSADGDRAYNYAVVNTTFPPGSTPQQHFNAAAQAMAKFGVTVGYIGIDLSQPTYNRAVTLWGMARDVLNNIAKGKKASASFQKQKITMTPDNEQGQGGAIMLNSANGLIGLPTQTTEGIYARCLINPAIDILSKVQINEALIAQTLPQLQFGTAGIEPKSETATIAADGVYVVRTMDIFGDTRGNPWYMDLLMTGGTHFGELGTIALNPSLGPN